VAGILPPRGATLEGTLSLSVVGDDRSKKG